MKKIQKVKGIEPNKKYMHESVTRSLMLVTALKTSIGYDKSSEIAKRAYKDGTSLRDATLALGYLSGEEFDLLVQPEKMTCPEKIVLDYKKSRIILPINNFTNTLILSFASYYRTYCICEMNGYC